MAPSQPGAWLRAIPARPGSREAGHSLVAVTLLAGRDVDGAARAWPGAHRRRVRSVPAPEVGQLDRTEDWQRHDHQQDDHDPEYADADARASDAGGIERGVARMLEPAGRTFPAPAVGPLAPGAAGLGGHRRPRSRRAALARDRPCLALRRLRPGQPPQGQRPECRHCYGRRPGPGPEPVGHPPHPGPCPPEHYHWWHRERGHLQRSGYRIGSRLPGLRTGRGQSPHMSILT
jgi:hypothetical protein